LPGIVTSSSSCRVTAPEESLNCTLAVIALPLLLASATPRTTVVVLAGVVYSVPYEELLTSANEAFLKVFAIIYPSAIASAVAVASI
jgi:hypothetical protein